MFQDVKIYLTYVYAAAAAGRMLPFSVLSVLPPRLLLRSPSLILPPTLVSNVYLMSFYRVPVPLVSPLVAPPRAQRTGTTPYPPQVTPPSWILYIYQVATTSPVPQVRRRLRRLPLVYVVSCAVCKRGCRHSSRVRCPRVRLSPCVRVVLRALHHTPSTT